MLRAVMALTLILEVTGAHFLSAASKTFIFSNAPATGLLATAALDGDLDIRRELFARTASAASLGGDAPEDIISARVHRWVGAEDVLAEADDYNFEGQPATAYLVGRGRPFPLIGKVSASGTAITGAGTRFTEQLAESEGFYVDIDGQKVDVDSITDDEAFASTIAHVNGATGVAAWAFPVYTAASPLVVATGVQARPDRDEEGYVFHLRPEVEALRAKPDRTFKGRGDAVYFKGSGWARSPSSMTYSPPGDFTVGARAYLMLESLSSTQVLMSNGDIEVKLVAGVPTAVIKTTTGTHSVAGPAALTPESFYRVDGRWQKTPRILEILVDGEPLAANTGASGDLLTTGNRWVLGADEPRTGSFVTGVAGEFAWFSAALSDDEAAEILKGAISPDEADLAFLVPGEVGVDAPLSMFETAAGNAAAPPDFVLSGTQDTDWALASHLDAPELAGEERALALGPIEHALAQQVDGHNYIMEVVGAPVQDVEKVYESGESGDDGIPGAPARGEVRNTLKEVLDNRPGFATVTGSLVFTKGSTAVTGTSLNTQFQDGDFARLDADDSWVRVAVVASSTSMTLSAPYSGTGGAGAGSRLRNLFDVWPGGGGFRLANFPAGSMRADVLSEGFGLRGMKFDKIDDSVSFGTSGNSIFTSDFEIEFLFTPSAGAFGDTGTILDNYDIGSPGGVQIVLNYQGDGDDILLAAKLLLANGTQIGAEHSFLHAGLTYHILWQVAEVAGDVISTLYVDLVESDEQTGVGTTLGTSAVALVVGDFSVVGTSFLGGAIAEFRVLSGNRSIGAARKQAYEAIAFDDSALELLIPCRVEQVLVDAGAWFPTATVRNEATSGAFGDGTITGATWIGGPSPCNPLAQIEWLLRELGGMATEDFVVLDLYDAIPADTVHVYDRENGSVRALVGQVRESHNLYDYPDPAGVYHVGPVADPSTQTAAASFVQAEISRLHIAEPRPLPTHINVAHRWIQEPEEDVSDLVAPRNRALWRQQKRYARIRSWRNLRLEVPVNTIEIDGRFRYRRAAGVEGKRQRSLYHLRRYVVSAALDDPGRAVRPGRYVSLTHEDLRGGGGSFLVLSAERAATSERVEVEAFGLLDEPA